MEKLKFLQTIGQNKDLIEQLKGSEIQKAGKKELRDEKGLFQIKREVDGRVQIERDEKNFGPGVSLYYNHDVIYQTYIETADGNLLFLADTGRGIFKSEDSISATRIAYIDSTDNRLVVNPKYEDDLRMLVEHERAKKKSSNVPAKR